MNLYEMKNTEIDIVDKKDNRKKMIDNNVIII